jgi:hypothetical protein
MSALPIAQALRLVAALQDINVDYVIRLHCTGEPFYGMAKVEMPNMCRQRRAPSRPAVHAGLSQRPRARRDA